jgi:hypothetical protein
MAFLADQGFCISVPVALYPGRLSQTFQSVGRLARQMLLTLNSVYRYYRCIVCFSVVA